MIKPSKLHNHKGAAIEIAIVTMLVIFGLCMILLTVNELLAYNNKTSLTIETTRRNLSQIGDAFYEAHRTRATFNPEKYRGDYTPVQYTFSDSDNTLLLVYETGTGTPKLAVEITADGSDCRIVLWTYSYSVIDTQYTLDSENLLASYKTAGE